MLAAGFQLPAHGMATAPTPLKSTPTPTPTPIAATNRLSVPSGVADLGFGFNSPWMYAATTNVPPNASAELTAAVRELNKPYMRFPGGTVSRDYLMSSTGYNGQQPGATENYIYPFTRIFSTTSSSGLVKIFYQINMDYHFNHLTYKGSDEDLIQENLRAIQYLMDHGLAPEAYELGNEESLTPQIFWKRDNTPFKPIETLQENLDRLVDIKITYTNNQAYTINHLKDGFDKFQSLTKIYRERLLSLHQARGLPSPKFGIPIHIIQPKAIKYFGDTRFFLEYYNQRMRDVPNMDALIPHYYISFEKGQSAGALAAMEGVFKEFRSFFGNSKEFWVTEFNAQVLNNGKSYDDTDEQVEVLTQMVNIFKQYGSTRYFLHQFFAVSSDSGYGVIYKKTVEGSRPVNGMTKTSSGQVIPDPHYGKSLFYSPMFCWSAKMQGASTQNYQRLIDEYGCKGI